MITGLQQTPMLKANLPSLVTFWNSGFAASRAVMTYVVERGMSEEDFLHVAKSQAPLFDLVRDEVEIFSRVGWGAIPGSPNTDDLSSEDKKRLALFRHDVAGLEGFFPSMVQLAEVNQDRLRSWYGHAQFLYRKRLAVEQLIRGICYLFHPQSSEKGIHVASRVQLERCFSVDAFDPAKTAFRNIISNAIKYGKEGGQLNIWNEGLNLFFRDDGIGMHNNFAARLGRGEQLREGRSDAQGEGLGWLSIGDVARKLKWSWRFQSELNKGTTVHIKLHQSNFSKPVSPWGQERDDRSDPVTKASIIDGSRTFIGAEPFQGYFPRDGGWFWVTQSPIFQATEQARELVNYI